MKKLFCPWRNEYTTDTGNSKQENTTPDQCVFCQQFEHNTDNANFILKRTKNHIVILNRYPYNAGHLLVLPITHTARLHTMTPKARAEFIELCSASAKIVEETLDAQGINIGMNLGKAAGAGIPSHLHMHILPRWLGDTNFLPVFGATKQVSFDLTEIFNKLKPAFDAL